MLSESAEKLLPEWSPVSPRIIMVRFNSRGRKVTIINRYALINNTAQGQKEEFYSFLQSRLNHSPRRGVKILLGKFNVQIGHDNACKGGVARRYGLSCMKENGEQCTCFCPFSNFSHKTIHNTTWMISPDGRTQSNQIDHITIARKWRTSLKD